jgi:type IV pilus assembly protein PilC
MYRKASLSRVLRTLGSTVSAGVSVLDAVSITTGVVGNRLFARILQDAYHKLEQGQQLSDALVHAPYLPRPIWQMIHAGERGGQLGPTMEKVADLCESDLRHAIRTATQFIEPAMIVVMGFVIGTIALAMLLPIFQISRVMIR